MENTDNTDKEKENKGKPSSRITGIKKITNNEGDILSGIIEVTSNGKSYAEFLLAIKQEFPGINLCPQLDDPRIEKSFIPTVDKTYKLKIVAGREFATDNERTYSNILKKGAELGGKKSKLEAFFLLREKLTRKIRQPYFSLHLMCDPITDSNEMVGNFGMSAAISTWSMSPGFCGPITDKLQFARHCLFALEVD